MGGDDNTLPMLGGGQPDLPRAPVEANIVATLQNVDHLPAGNMSRPPTLELAAYVTTLHNSYRRE